MASPRAATESTLWWLGFHEGESLMYVARVRAELIPSRWNPAQRILFVLCLLPLIFVWPAVLLVWLLRPRNLSR